MTSRGQEYARRAIAPIGDHCEWFAYSAEAILEAPRDRRSRANPKSMHWASNVVMMTIDYARR